MEILFGTSNKHKLVEAKSILKPEFVVKQYPIDLIEIQSNDLKQIATFSLQNITEINQPIFVEDTGFFIRSLNGFPGPFAAYCLQTISNPGILKLMKGETDRNSYFHSFIAFRDNTSIKTFEGVCQGLVSKKIRGKKWGFDPIFIPISNENEKNKTFAELKPEIKNSISHRAKALFEFKNYLIQTY